MRVTNKQKQPIHQEEEGEKRDFPTSYTEVKEDNRQINEEKDPKWMDTEIMTK